MGATLVVKADPVADHATGVLLALKAVTMHALLFEGPDHSFDHPVLLRVVW